MAWNNTLTFICFSYILRSIKNVNNVKINITEWILLSKWWLLAAHLVTFPGSKYNVNNKIWWIYYKNKAHLHIVVSVWAQNLLIIEANVSC
jgi:hypothetical protein